MTTNKILLLAGLSLLTFACIGLALGQIQYVKTAHSRGSFPICSANAPAAICVDTNDFPGVLIAANNLQTDIARVTGRTSEMFHPGESRSCSHRARSAL